jgi:hypothetical protein
MKILAIEKALPGITAEQLRPHLKAEALVVWELYQAGIFRELNFRGDWPGAVLVLECATVEEAHSVLTTLPLVNEGLVAFEVIPLIPYPGFARLFGGEDRSFRVID